MAGVWKQSEGGNVDDASGGEGGEADTQGQQAGDGTNTHDEEGLMGQSYD